MNRWYNPQQILRTAINRIIEKEPFWSKLIAASPIKIVSGNTCSIEGLNIKIGQDTILKYSYESENYLDTSEIETIILNIFLSIGFLHEIRGQDKLNEVWNTACNIYKTYLLHREGYKLPKDIEENIESITKKINLLKENTEEKIYNKLLENWNNEVKKQAEEINKAMGKTEKTKGSKDETNILESLTSKQEANEDIEIVVQQMLMLGEKAGNVPAYFKEKIENIRKTNFNLKAILKEFMERVTEPEQYNWQRPNRRYIPHKIFYPTLDKSEKAKGIVIAFDTSGSCFEVTKKFVGIIHELNEIYNEGEPINLLYCDCGNVHHEVWQGKELPNPVGGGGTSYAPVMKWVRKNREITALIYITDGQCEDFGPHPRIPIIWLILDIYNEGERILKNIPFGRKILFSKKQVTEMIRDNDKL